MSAVERSLSAILNPKTSSSSLGSLGRGLSRTVSDGHRRTDGRTDGRTRQDGARVKFLRVISARLWASLYVPRTLYDGAAAINCGVARARVSIFEVNKPDLDLPPVPTAAPLLSCDLSSLQRMHTTRSVCANRAIMSKFTYHWKRFSSFVIISTKRCDEEDIEKKWGIVHVRKTLHSHLQFSYMSSIIKLIT
jgi:hypothetical protein